MNAFPHNRQSGFTLIEIGVIAPIIIVIALALFEVLFALNNSADAERTRINITYEKQAAMNMIESDVRLSNSFLTTNSSTIVDPYSGPSLTASPPSTTAWSTSGNGVGNRVLILRSFATTANPFDGTRQPVYVGSGTACNTANLQADPVLSYNTIYFVQNQTLYRRILVDTTTGTCPSTVQYEKLSCPSLTTLGTGSRDSRCSYDDEVIATNVSYFSIDYYTSGSATSPTDVYSGDNSAVTASNSINVTLTQTRSSSSGPISGTSSLRIATVNSGGS